ncbi:MAG: hypothetical protein UT34_C0001G0446 [candidate division WS6 bacterium GW2011_GWF2_39_15]|uniref:Uncharacterized protein n=1 Tax=candidate division WS6 bacterium GW2011_GWF2_39_15 TaxID=1619100 RepID=A0A0G0N0P3_9BACT|nr:MAG: hypothetical protein UT34_C0001G0446 [candidate division WS6 bacterium GW2011_GWF2_39_15]
MNFFKIFSGTQEKPTREFYPEELIGEYINPQGVKMSVGCSVNFQDNEGRSRTGIIKAFVIEKNLKIPFFRTTDRPEEIEWFSSDSVFFNNSY